MSGQGRRTLLPPPTATVDAVIARARLEGRNDASLWLDYAWRPATWGPSNGRELVALLDCCRPDPVAAFVGQLLDDGPGAIEHVPIETAPMIGCGRPFLTSSAPAAGERRGEVLVWRLAVCARHRIVWYEARVVAPSAPRRPGAGS